MPKSSPEDALFPPPSLYTQVVYAAEKPADIVRQWPFANLVSPDLHVTATPILFETEGSEATMIGHLARRNPHAADMRAGQAVVAIFMGPHDYISPRWYHEKPTVPTWNYVSAHVRGLIEPIDDDETQLRILRQTIDHMEQGAAQPWRMEDAPEGRVDQLLPMIRSFRIHVKRIEGTTKLSQTHPAGDQDRVIAGLEAQGPDVHIADLMRGLRN